MRLRLGWSAAAVALLCAVALLGTTGSVGLSASTATNRESVVVGMPFSGKWAWTLSKSPCGSDACDSYPKYHARYSADWATDLYAAPGTAVKLRLTNATGTLRYSASTSDTSCGAGKRVRINLTIDGLSVGWIQYEHLDTTGVSLSTIKNGMTLGKLKNWGYKTCYQVRSDAGVHAHVGMANTTNYSCWIAYSKVGSSLTGGSAIGIVGANNTGYQQACPMGMRPPIGSLDSVTSPAASKVRARGWAADWDAPKTALRVHLYVDGKNTNDITANGTRTDVSRVYPAFGSGHGFDTTFAVAPGKRKVCAYAINQPKGSNPQLGCKTVTVAKPAALPPPLPNTAPLITDVAGASGVVDGQDPVLRISYRDADCNVRLVRWESQAGSPAPASRSAAGSCSGGNGWTVFGRSCYWSGTWTEYIILDDALGNQSNRFAFTYRCDPPFPTPQPSFSGCSVTQTRSLSGNTASMITFENESGAPVALFWLDYGGTPTYYTTLGTARSISKQTFITHPWIAVSQDGRCRGFTVSDSSSKTYAIP